MSESDAEGKLRFGEYGKVARVKDFLNLKFKFFIKLLKKKNFKYIRIEYKANIREMVEYLHGKFNIKKPQLIISVTGGAKNFTIPLKTKNAFKLGLIKAATSTNALIITGGTNTGVMKLVGDAIAESVIDTSCIDVLGIATWGIVADRDKLEKEEKNGSNSQLSDNNIAVDYRPDNSEENGVLFDSNHSHFILVDNGSVGKYGVEIKFRSDLENELRNSASSFTNSNESYSLTIKPERIPVILIVVHGGPNTLTTVLESIDNDVPVLVLAVILIYFLIN